MYQHILVPTDGSALSKSAIEQAAGLARALKAHLTIVTVTTPFQPVAAEPIYARTTALEHEKDMDKLSARILAEAKAIADSVGVSHSARHASSDQPWQAIIETAQSEGCDLIAMASHGRSGLAAIVLGSETTRVLTHSRIPVIVYR
jgi:nucleotide-binding universal stress UspA family protein